MEPKAHIETLMDTNTEAEYNNSRAQPTNANKSKLHNTLKETSINSKTATQGKQNRGRKKLRVKVKRAQNGLHEALLDKKVKKRTPTANHIQAE